MHQTASRSTGDACRCLQDALSQLWKLEEAKPLIQTRKLTAEHYFTLGGLLDR